MDNFYFGFNSSVCIWPRNGASTRIDNVQINFLKNVSYISIDKRKNTSIVAKQHAVFLLKNTRVNNNHHRINGITAFLRNFL